MRLTKSQFKLHDSEVIHSGKPDDNLSSKRLNEPRFEFCVQLDSYQPGQQLSIEYTKNTLTIVFAWGKAKLLVDSCKGLIERVFPEGGNNEILVYLKFLTHLNGYYITNSIRTYFKNASPMKSSFL